MTSELLKELLDACFIAKRITKSMPDLPCGLKPRHIHVIDAIYELRQKYGTVRVSDVSKRLDITMPSVTKLINELTVMGVVEKAETSADKRAMLLRLTKKGHQYEEQYVIAYHAQWAERITDITDDQAAAAIRTIISLQKAMPEISE